VQRHDTNRLVVTAAIDADRAEACGRLTLVAHGPHVVGLVRTNGLGWYRIDTTATGHTLRTMDPARSDGCAAEWAPAVELSEPAAAGAPCDDGTVIDVLVVYTSAARIAAGGVAAIEAEIDLSIALTNEVYANSLVALEVNLAHTEEIDYDENGTYDQHLERLRLTDDGVMDEVHALRDAHDADLVNLFLAAGGSCGFAYRMVTQSAGFDVWAFSVVRWTCAANALSFAHELGHNQGCCHDHADGCVNPLFDDAFAHRFNGAHAKLYRTVMATTPGTKIPNFSNPDVIHDGVPTGVPPGQPEPAHNAATIAATALTVANFRCSGAPTCTEDLDGSGDVGFGDILQVIGAWGPCAACPEDLDGSGDVGFGDILVLIAGWGPC
jgi:hypothetical protein